MLTPRKSYVKLREEEEDIYLYYYETECRKSSVLKMKCGSFLYKGRSFYHKICG